LLAEKKNITQQLLRHRRGMMLAAVFVTESHCSVTKRVGEINE